MNFKVSLPRTFQLVRIFYFLASLDMRVTQLNYNGNEASFCPIKEEIFLYVVYGKSSDLVIILNYQ